VEACATTDGAKKEPPPVGCCEGHQQPAALAQPIEPEWSRMGHAGESDDGIDLARIMGRAVAGDDIGLCPGPQILPGSGRKASVILDRYQGPGCPDDLGQHRAVVSGTSPELHDSLAGPQSS